VRVHDADDSNFEEWDIRAVQLREMLIDTWRPIREAQLIDFDDERKGLDPRHFDKIYDEYQLEVELLSMSSGRDLPNEILRWISFKHRGPPPRRRSFSDLPRTEASTTQGSHDQLDVEETRQGQEKTNSGPRTRFLPPAARGLPFSHSCECFGFYRTVEERIKLRRKQGRIRFKWAKRYPINKVPEMSILALSELGLDGFATCVSISEVPFSPCSFPQGVSVQAALPSPADCFSLRSYGNQVPADQALASSVPADSVPVDSVPTDQVPEVPAVSPIRSESPIGSVSRFLPEPLSVDLE
jgi:hypothetical protein